MSSTGSVEAPPATGNTGGRRASGATSSGRTGQGGKGRVNLLGYLLLAPLVLIMGLVIGYPLVNTVRLSLQDQTIMGTSGNFVGLVNYRAVLADADFWSSIRHSGVWFLGNLVAQTIIAFATALLIGNAGRWARAARTWMLFPWVIPTVAVAVIWQWLSNSSYGLIPHLASMIGIEGLGSPFASPGLAMPALIIMNSWHWFPLGAVVIFGAIRTIPLEVFEAARVDGASGWRTFWSITLPIIQPILFALGLVGSLWSFNIVDSIYLVTKGGPANATTTAPVYIYNKAFSAFQASPAAAASVITIVLLALTAGLYIKLAMPREDR